MTSEKRHSEVTGIDLSGNRHTVGDNVKGPEWIKRGFQTPDLEQVWNRWGQGPMAGGRGGPRTGTHLAQGQSPRARSPWGLRLAPAWRTKGTGNTLCKWQGQREI